MTRFVLSIERCGFLLFVTLAVVSPSPGRQSFLRRRNSTLNKVVPWTLDSKSTSTLRERHLIINEKTEEEQVKLTNKFNPLTLLSEHGHRANISAYPFFAHWSLAYCGASLIHNDILLT